MIESLVEDYWKLKIKVNGNYETVYPSELCIYDKPYPYLKGTFNKSVRLVGYEYDEQMPEWMIERWERRGEY